MPLLCYDLSDNISCEINIKMVGEIIEVEEGDNYQG